MNIYTAFRKVHLYAGLAIMAFVTMYFVSGYPMIHHDWFPRPEPSKTTRVESLAYVGPADAVNYSRHLQETFGLRGKLDLSRRLRDGSWQFRYSRPGTFHEAIIVPAGDRVRITTRQDNIVETMVGFHRLRGYGSGTVYNLWSLLYDLASVSMILFAFTGIYLWYKLTKKRMLGWICLLISYGYATATVLYCMYAP